MVYLKISQAPEANKKCLIIGNSVLSFDVFSYEEKQDTLSGTQSYNIIGYQNKEIEPIVLDIVASNGNPVSYSLSDGALPSGLSLSDGIISGTPESIEETTAQITAASGNLSLIITLSFTITYLKYPSNLTSNTSDVDWKVVGTNDAYKVFDGNLDSYFQYYSLTNEVMYWYRQGVSSRGTLKITLANSEEKEVQFTLGISGILSVSEGTYTATGSLNTTVTASNTPTTLSIPFDAYESETIIGYRITVNKIGSEDFTLNFYEIEVL